MPLSAIVVVVLRLVAIYWFLTALLQFGGVLTVLFDRPLGADVYFWVASGSPLLLSAAAVLGFKYAEAIARKVVPQPDPAVSLGGVTPYDLYCFAFTFLGLSFFLAQFGRMLTWVHYYLLLQSGAPQVDPPGVSFYGPAEAIVTMVSAGLCLFFAPRFARRLMEMQARERRPGVAPGENNHPSP